MEGSSQLSGVEGGGRLYFIFICTLKQTERDIHVVGMGAWKINQLAVIKLAMNRNSSAITRTIRTEGVLSDPHFLTNIRLCRSDRLPRPNREEAS